MRFSFKCHVAKHVSGRVTVTPVGLPELALHAGDMREAIEELTLALDDRLGRAHPRRLFDLARPTIGEPAVLDLPVVRVWGPAQDEIASLKVHVLVAPVHRQYQEVHAPRLDARLWFAERDPRPLAQARLCEQLAEMDDGAVLDLRREAPESWIDIDVDVTPLRLSDLKRSELTLDERPPARPRSASTELDDDEVATS